MAGQGSHQLPRWRNDDCRRVYLVLLTNCTLFAWGIHTPFNVTDVPSNLTNITLISAQALHSLALASNGSVAAWGYGSDGETNVPAGLSNVVAVAA